MSIETVFTSLIGHMTEGIMFHDELAQLFGFLAMDKNVKEHQARAMSESFGRERLIRYYLEHYGKLPGKLSFTKPDLIPDSWRTHVRTDVDSSTRRSGTRDAYARWHDWERKTKELYQRSYKELCDLGEYAAADRIMEYIRDVDSELAELDKERIAE